jgi:hypothetical protein
MSLPFVFAGPHPNNARRAYALIAIWKTFSSYDGHERRPCDGAEDVGQQMVPTSVFRLLTRIKITEKEPIHGT